MLAGKITYEAVAEAHGLEYTPLDVGALSAVAPAGSATRSSAGRTLASTRASG